MTDAARKKLEQALCSYRAEYAEMVHPLTCEIDAILAALKDELRTPGTYEICATCGTPALAKMFPVCSPDTCPIRGAKP